MLLSQIVVNSILVITSSFTKLFPVVVAVIVIVGVVVVVVVVETVVVYLVYQFSLELLLWFLVVLYQFL